MMRQVFLAVFCLVRMGILVSEGKKTSVELPVFKFGAEGEVVKKALREVGAVFVQVEKGKGFGKELMDAAKEFFAGTSEEEKKKIQIQSSGLTRGFVPVGGESGSQRPEVKEAFSYGFDWDKHPDKNPSNALEGLNVWPSNGLARTHQAKFEGAFDMFVQTSKLLIKTLFTTYPGLENAEKLCEQGEYISLLRVFHYFSKSSEQYRNLDCINPAVDCIGSSSHTDWGFLTLILSTEMDGIELFLNDSWVTVRPSDNFSVDNNSELLLMNVGDILSMAVDDGSLRSPQHQVVLSESERFSFVFFFYPNFDARFELHESSYEVSLLKDQSSSGRGLIFHDIKKMTFGEVILAKWQQVFRAKQNTGPVSVGLGILSYPLILFASIFSLLTLRRQGPGPE